MKDAVRHVKDAVWRVKDTVRHVKDTASRMSRALPLHETGDTHLHLRGSWKKKEDEGGAQLHSYSQQGAADRTAASERMHNVSLHAAILCFWLCGCVSFTQ